MFVNLNISRLFPSRVASDFRGNAGKPSRLRRPNSARVRSSVISVSFYFMEVAFLTSTGFAGTIVPGETWKDVGGKSIEAHAAAITQVDGVYYWSGTDQWEFDAVTLYSSTDLENWKFENRIIRSADSPLFSSSRLTYGPACIAHNSKLNEYILFLVTDTKEFSDGKMVVASCPTINGNYKVLGTFYGASNSRIRDFVVYQDGGKTYLIYYSQDASDVCIDELDDDFQSVRSRVCKLNAGVREAPCPFKKDGVYYMYTSGQSGWGATQGMYQTATSLAGPWSGLKKFGDATTYKSQGRCIFPVAGTRETTFVYAGDRWWPKGTYDSSRYVWLPIKFGPNSTMSMDWYAKWNIDTTSGTWSIPSADAFGLPNSWRGPVGESATSRRFGAWKSSDFTDERAAVSNRFEESKRLGISEIQIDPEKRIKCDDER